MRDELLNETLFFTIGQARSILTRRVDDDNTGLPLPTGSRRPPRIAQVLDHGGLHWPKSEMVPILAVTTIAQTIQLSLSPVFMLAGIGAILNVLAGRLGRVVDRARDLELRHEATSGTERARYQAELRLLDRRMSIVNAALFLCVSSAVATCLVVALLFTGELTGVPIGTVVAITFVLSMALLISGLAMFIIEVRLSLRATRVRVELLEREME